MVPVGLNLTQVVLVGCLLAAAIYRLAVFLEDRLVP